MSEADFSLVMQAVIGIAAAVAAFYGYRNHEVGKSNAAKIDTLTSNPPPPSPP